MLIQSTRTGYNMPGRLLFVKIFFFRTSVWKQFFCSFNEWPLAAARLNSNSSLASVLYMLRLYLYTSQRSANSQGLNRVGGSQPEPHTSVRSVATQYQFFCTLSSPFMSHKWAGLHVGEPHAKNGLTIALNRQSIESNLRCVKHSLITPTLG